MTILKRTILKTIDTLISNYYYCKRIALKEKSKRDKNESSSSSEDEAKKSDDDEFIHHPFKVKDLSSIVMNIRDSKPLPLQTPQEKLQQQAQLRLTFPVSSGSTHRMKESEWVPVQKTTATATKPTTTAATPTTATTSATTATTSVTATTATSSTTPAAPLPVDVKPNPVRPEDKVFPDAPQQSLDISSIISERLSAFKQLQQNPHDLNAMKNIAKASEKASQWAQSKHLPGKFIGSTGAQILSQDELMGPDKRRQAWAKKKRKKKTEFRKKYSTEVVKKILLRSLNRRYYKPLKDQFVKAAPVRSGIGMALLQKMGWKQGEGLGKNKEGGLEPLSLDFKMDRRGLTSVGENTKKVPGGGGGGGGGRGGGGPPIRDLSGKHPVSALVELCNRRKWGPPDFQLQHESGPDHKKNFLFKVVVHNVAYQPSIASNNKKTAKAAAATACLQELGLVPR